MLPALLAGRFLTASAPWEGTEDERTSSELQLMRMLLGLPDVSTSLLRHAGPVIMEVLSALSLAAKALLNVCMDKILWGSFL